MKLLKLLQIVIVLFSYYLTDKVFFFNKEIKCQLLPFTWNEEGSAQSVTTFCTDMDINLKKEQVAAASTANVSHAVCQAGS